MERHRCRLCFRNFSNGRALGGHMRSHVMNLSPPSRNSSRRSEEPDRSCPLIHSCSSSQGEVVLQDVESDAETSKHGETNEELSSVSGITAEEDVAHCLMMLSRDRWEKESDEDENDDVSEDSSPLTKVKRAKVRGKYKCETCNKLFKSYQALGGHRASYKKIRAAAPCGGAPAAAAEKVHECPFCHRVFASGQALGGHKRSHFMGTSNFTNFSKVSRIGENFDIIDLNLPAPVDDGDEINFSEQR